MNRNNELARQRASDMANAANKRATEMRQRMKADPERVRRPFSLIPFLVIAAIFVVVAKLLHFF